MTKSSRYAEQIIITQAGTIKLGLSYASLRVIRGRVKRVSLCIYSVYIYSVYIEKKETRLHCTS